MEFENNQNNKLTFRKNLDITKFRFYNPTNVRTESNSKKNRRCVSNINKNKNTSYSAKKNNISTKSDYKIKKESQVSVMNLNTTRLNSHSNVTNNVTLNNNTTTNFHSNKPSLNIIKTVKEENRKRLIQQKKMSGYGNNKSNQLYDSYDSKTNIYIIESMNNIHDHNLLNAFLKQKFYEKQKNKKWYSNYKADSNENSMLDIQSQDIFIPSDKEICIIRDREIMYENSRLIKECLSNILDNESSNERKIVEIFKNPYLELFN